MAARKIHRSYLARDDTLASTDSFEFDEAEVWSAANDVVDDKSESPKAKLNYPSHRPIWKPARKSAMAVDHRPAVGPKSLPVNVPDWSKILRDEYRSPGGDFTDDDDEEEDDGNERMPPHEYLARTRAASFSVHEGIGRTLKGRDMSRVRNAIWKQIGLLDED